MQRIEFLDVPMDVCTMDETVAVIRDSVRARQFVQHVVVNVAKVVNMRRDPALDQSVRACDIINIDGMGLVFGARLFGHRVPERVAGVDLFHRLMAMSRDEGFPVYLLGATEAVVERTALVVTAQYPGLEIAGYHHGYFWDDEEAMVAKIRASGARLLFVAITSPKKENFIARWREGLGVDFVMGVGGTFDVVAGRAKRAPVWMQKLGFEWLYRVLQEPRRLLGRYAYTNTAFGGLLVTEFFKRGKSNRS